MERLLQLDHSIQQYIAQIRFPILDMIAKSLDLFGGDVRLYAFIFILLFIPKKTRKLAVLLLLAVVVTIVTVTWIKVFVGRPRPFVTHRIVPIIVVDTSEYYVSFPSGHTAAIATIAMICCLYTRRYWKVGVAAILIMAWSRMYLYMHYPSDTCIGACIGLACAYSIYLLYLKYSSKEKKEAI